MRTMIVCVHFNAPSSCRPSRKRSADDTRHYSAQLINGIFGGILVPLYDLFEIFQRVSDSDSLSRWTARIEVNGFLIRFLQGFIIGLYSIRKGGFG